VSPRSGLLAAWTNAFVAGHASLDQVVDGTTGADQPHVVTGLAGPGERSGLHDLVVCFRRGGEPVRVALPVPGDVRGVPGPRAFRDAALAAGEAVVCGLLGVVPAIVEFHPSSAPTQVEWTVYRLEDPSNDYEAVADAQFELATAIRETASALAAADVASRDVPAELADARRRSEHLDLPPGHPQRAVALLAQAERMQAVLELALADPAGGAVDRFGMSARDAALRPLATAVRRARVAGYSAV
jgi:hypothetical protein